MLDDDHLIQLLGEHDLLRAADLGLAQSLQQESNLSLYSILMSHRLVDEADVLAVLSETLHIPSVSLTEFTGNAQVLEQVPRALAEAYGVLPIGLMQDGVAVRLVLAMTDPSDFMAIETIGQVTGYDVEPVLVGPSDLELAIARVYNVALEHVDVVPIGFRRPEGTRVGANWGRYEGERIRPGSGPIAGLSLADVDLPDLLLNDSSDLGDTPGQFSSSPTRPGQRREAMGFRRGGSGLSNISRVSINVFSDLMRASSVRLLSPLETAQLQGRSMSEVGSKELLQAIVRVMVKRGLITEKELMEEVAEVRKGRGRGER